MISLSTQLFKNRTLDEYDSMFLKKSEGYVISESETEHELEVIVTGHSKETVEITTTGSYLHVVARPLEGSSSLTKSQSFRFKLPTYVNETDIVATVKDGILKIKFPKLNKSAKTSKIEVR